MSKSSFIVAIILTIALAFFFYFNANLDLQVASHFYLGNNDFVLLHQTWAKELRTLQNQYLYVFGILILLGFLLLFIFPKSKLKAKFLIYTLAVFIIVPVLVVNVGFKNHFHRPRPRQVVQLGGDMQFKPAWVISDECSTNCSFVCGDAAAAFIFWAFLPFFRRGWKFAYGILIGLLGALYGYVRIGQGGHFLSDVIFAGLVSYISIWIVYWFFYRFNPKWLHADVLQSLFLRAHNFVLRRKT